ncbi:conserved hypothetical protein, partial [Ricinus communis]
HFDGAAVRAEAFIATHIQPDGVALLPERGFKEVVDTIRCVSADLYRVAEGAHVVTFDPGPDVIEVAADPHMFKKDFFGRMRDFLSFFGDRSAKRVRYLVTTEEFCDLQADFRIGRHVRKGEGQLTLDSVVVVFAVIVTLGTGRVEFVVVDD